MSLSAPRSGFACFALSLALLAAPPVLADIQAGRIAFSQGDYATAFKEFNAAATAGDSSGQYLAGEMLMQGRGIAKDSKRGLTLLEASARGGHVGAQSMVGAIYAFGQDMPADYTKALSFLRPAAAAGDMHAQNNLAALTFFGLGTERDIVEALTWARRASAKRLVAAIRLEKDIMAQATPEQIAAADARAREPLAPLAPPTPIAQAPTSTPSAKPAKVEAKPAAKPPASAAPPPAQTEAPKPAPAPPATAPAQAGPAPAARPTPEPLPPPPAAEPPPAPAPQAVAAAPETPAPTRGVPISRTPPAAPVSAPPVPVAAPMAPPAPAPAPKPSAPPATPAAGGWVIQVGSLPSAAEADKHWKALQAKQAGLLAGRQPTMVQADLGAKGTYTRVFLTGFADQTAANGLCQKLKAGGADCLVKKTP